MKKIYLLAAATLSLAACNNDNNYAEQPLAAQISASISGSVASRASDDSWAAGDKIGITATVKEMQPHVNMEYITDGSEKFTGKPIYYYKPMKLTAYYPFKGTEGVAPGIVEARTDINYQTSENQPKIDFLWDSQESISIEDSKPVINFSFTHKMSKLTFIFNPSDDGGGIDVGKIVSYKIEGLILDGTFDPETGECTANSEAGTESLDIAISKGSAEAGKAVSPLIVFPQTPGNGNVTLHIFTDEVDNPEALQHYKCSLSFSDGEIKPGNNYLYTITVSKTGLSTKTSINNWTDTDLESGAQSAD